MGRQTDHDGAQRGDGSDGRPRPGRVFQARQPLEEAVPGEPRYARLDLRPLSERSPARVCAPSGEGRPPGPPSLPSPFGARNPDQELSGKLTGNSCPEAVIAGRSERSGRLAPASDLVPSIATRRRTSTLAAQTAHSRLRQLAPQFLQLDSHTSADITENPAILDGEDLPLTGQPLHSRYGFAPSARAPPSVDSVPLEPRMEFLRPTAVLGARREDDEASRLRHQSADSKTRRGDLRVDQDRRKLQAHSVQGPGTDRARVPLRWSRLQPAPNVALDSEGSMKPGASGRSVAGTDGADNARSTLAEPLVPLRPISSASC